MALMAPDDPCDQIQGAAGEICENGGGSGGGAPSVENPLDPFQQLAHEVAKAAGWTAKQLGKVLTSPQEAVDFTNASFLQQYALVFAASTILVLVLWLAAVAKRAMRGASMTTAMGEAIGLLWLAVAACAFTPAILYVLISATHGVTTVLVDALGSSPGGLFNSWAKDLEAGKVGGGPLILTVTSLATMLLCGALWLLLVLRALGLYVGAVLGVVVYAALVDRDWWGHIRKWAAFMIALVLAEPVIVIVLGLTAALQTSGDQGAVVTGLAVTVIALGVTIALIWKVPGWGDAIKVARMSARTAGGAAGALIGGRNATASAGVMHGIHTHGSRQINGTPRTPSSSSGSSSGGAAGGIAAHSQRTPKKKDGNGKGKSS
ncbi:hypothetical protein [Streptomyces olivaceiscleroticus]|uniref:Integral membrane protein n=1 Tax=Streptomyces olivaceiscleroticus TaxID=68245 RepID=A0ABP3JI26_9ACTN